MKKYTPYQETEEYKNLVKATKAFIKANEDHKWVIGEVMDEVICEMVLSKVYRDENGDHGLQRIEVRRTFNTCGTHNFAWVKKYKENGFYFKPLEKLE